eukprot:218830-Prorocentrum_minimum.AAC.3
MPALEGAHHHLEPTPEAPVRGSSDCFSPCVTSTSFLAETVTTAGRGEYFGCFIKKCVYFCTFGVVDSPK